MGFRAGTKKGWASEEESAGAGMGSGQSAVQKWGFALFLTCRSIVKFIGAIELNLKRIQRFCGLDFLKHTDRGGT
jgi:hypothetical protein